MIENPTENPAPQVTELVSRPRFDWRAFFAHLTTFFSVVIILALGLGFLILRKPIREKAEQVVSREPARIVFGVCLILIIIYMPEGIMGLVRALARRRRP